MENDRLKFKNEFKKRLYAVVLRLVRFVDALPKDIVSSVLIKQLIRSSTSVLANYVEAGSASSRKDFINFFSHSLKSANETKLWISLLRDAHKGNEKELDTLLKEFIEISNVLASSILTLKNRK